MKFPNSASVQIQRDPQFYSRYFEKIENVFWMNGIQYSDLLHEKQEVEIDIKILNRAVQAFCQEHNIEYVIGDVYKNYGRGGLWNGVHKIKMNPSNSPRQTFITSIHEIVHCMAHYFHGWRNFPKVPRPVQEAEAYIVEYRVASFFLPRNYVENDFNLRLYWYGPKRNTHMVREEQCVEFADELIYWLIDWLHKFDLL